MKLFLSFFILLFSGGCSDPVEEPALMSQLLGQGCSHLATLPARHFEMAYPTYQPRCEATGIFSSWTVRNYKELCIVSGALCMIELPSVSQSSLDAMGNFLRVGMNDVDTGDGIFPVRGPVALAYAKLARDKATPALEFALKRMDTAGAPEGSSFPPDHVFKPGTSHDLIREALSLSNPR